MALCSIIEALNEKGQNDIADALKLIQEDLTGKDAKISNLQTDLNDKAKKIIDMENNITDLQERMLSIERYNSKDSVIIWNPPPPQRDIPVEEATIEFLNTTLNLSLKVDGVKACHYLGKVRENSDKLPPIIMKFVYFADKNIVWRRKRNLKGIKNPANGKPIFITERLPQADKEVQEYARERGVVTTTHNCAVQIMYKEGQMVKFQEVRSAEEVDREMHRALTTNPAEGSRGRYNTDHEQRQYNTRLRSKSTGGASTQRDKDFGKSGFTPEFKKTNYLPSNDNRSIEQ